MAWQELRISKSSPITLSAGGRLLLRLVINSNLFPMLICRLRDGFAIGLSVKEIISLFYDLRILISRNDDFVVYCSRREFFVAWVVIAV